MQSAILVLLAASILMGIEASVNRTAFKVAHPKKTLLQQLHICDQDRSVQRSIYSAAQMDALPIEWAMASAGLTPTQNAPQEWKVCPWPVSPFSPEPPNLPSPLSGPWLALA